MKHFLISFLFSISILFAHANRIILTSVSQINSGKWLAGDTIVLKNNTYTDQSILIKGDGTAANPIVLSAETAGKVFLTGTSHIGISGQYVEVSGLFFKNGNLSGSEIVAFRTSSTVFADHCRLTNCAIVDCNPADSAVDSKWVSLYGANNKVDRCSFQNKTNSGTLMVVWLQTGITPNHIINQNYFGYRNANVDSTGSELNGQEIIRVGDSSTSMQTAGVSVTNNIFEHCNGEIEIISNKSCGNYYSNNLFLECKGMLTLRHGNSCTVDGNYFIGNGVANTGGVRIIGENHKVYNNYFENLTGTNYRSALCIVRGKENSALNEYFQVKNALVAFNTMVNCAQAFIINYNSSTTCTLPPIGTTIAHNHIFNTSASSVNVTIAQTNPLMDVVWKNNVMNQGKYVDFPYTSAQVITGKNAKMVQGSTIPPIFEPTSGSALSTYSTNNFPEISVDLRGRSRVLPPKIPGASQINGTTTRITPLRNSVGASFFDNGVTSIKTVPYSSKMQASVAHQFLTVATSKSGVITLYSVAGIPIFSEFIQEGIFTKYIESKGIYFLSYKESGGSFMLKKILVW
ncbi:MAG: polysaccharide lyase 6 family protein [Bacteroidales bacterium]